MKVNALKEKQATSNNNNHDRFRSKEKYKKIEVRIHLYWNAQNTITKITTTQNYDMRMKRRNRMDKNFSCEYARAASE